MRSTLLLPVDLLCFAARKVGGLSWGTKALLGAVGCATYYNKRRSAVTVHENSSLSEDAITDYVYFDLAADRRYLGRILIGLYGHHQPLTCENFVQMCKGYDVGGRRIGFLNSKVDQVFPRNGIIFGQLFHPGGPLSSCTIYGRTMPEESFELPFMQEGDVAMLSTSDQVGMTSRFLITLVGNPCLGRRPVVLGTVVKGMKLIRSLGNEQLDEGVPKRDLRIIGCGLYRGPEDGPKSFFVRGASALASPT
ncbi:peptidyl-prolyl cis-trans isomerase, cyclophilin-type, putative [Babesia bigemina]|uniref:Peptidyl-prolyl cis-trans isomerase, cyclophilin-type, putative n=1 Tax=Babesia bigemina TaxID=5866 RepID=A0A061DCE3_BABBI|nr:peptidyl-prolyl cis-trans isomerase, cyclophilin-type, putative [Babesia bigemina]CDR97747.1 peptidyl-prolyl cis-trans isomerase, cyclophilin-type, putative [Babesia bigemina]|eukprot:XP_012769933.1 peptidyl-prolyl cis-trans isomerase, cyclophilin-type, putative [Babesia bigemina]